MEQAAYSPIGDVLTIIITCILLTQITAGHTKRNSGYIFFLQMILFTAIAAVTNLIYYVVSETSGGSMPAGFYLLNVFHHVSLFTLQVLNILYLVRLVSLQGPRLKIIKIVSYSELLFFSILELISNYLSFVVPGLAGFRFKMTSTFAFLLFISLILWVLIANRSRIVRLVFDRLLMTYLFCLLVLGVQGIHGQTSFTTAIYLLPILQLIHFLHPTPFDAESGAFDESAFKNMIAASYKKKEKLFFACLHLYEYEDIRNFPDEMRFEIYHFYSDLVRRGQLFRLQQGRLILVFKEKYNKDPETVLKRVVDSFQKLYGQYHADFRVVLMESVDILSEKNHYLRFINFLEERISKNEFHRVTEQDIQDFTKRQYILNQLNDIAVKQDLDDPRVLVYCQPVYNVTTKIYDTAEALMRVRLPETGLLFPDQFISLAESHGFIHAMSLILLNKTCQTIKYTFADMFRKLDYDVLYEGVEDESDEIRCIRMLAGYLQGYKYSRPIEITKLIDFLSPQLSSHSKVSAG